MIKKLLENTTFINASHIGLLCNQTAWHRDTGYLFQALSLTEKLKTVFIPEHGLFGELQDQEKLNTTNGYAHLADGIKWVSLYNESKNALTAPDGTLNNHDCIIIDIQDVGSRYYTFISSIWLLFQQLNKLQATIEIIVLDKPNPAGRQVEGTRISRPFSSFIGIEGLPHRHGLTIGEMCRYFKNKIGGKWSLTIIPFDENENTFIPPSPNIPNIETCMVYPGQCLWEGSNFSEGRGTTLPFHVIGSPAAKWVFEENWNHKSHSLYQGNIQLRPLVFIPVFHKYKDEACYGLHLVTDNQKTFHSLLFSLQLIKYCREKTPGFEWRPGNYEALNDRPAIELLAGDEDILDYLNGNTSLDLIKEKFEFEEREWIREASSFLNYPKPLTQKTAA